MIRFFSRWFGRLLFALVVLVVGVVLAKDIFLRPWLAHRLRTVTGLDTRLAGLHTAFLQGTVTLTDLRISNAPAFGGGLLLDAPSIRLELDGQALSRREIRLKSAHLHLAEISLVRSADGRTNLHEVVRAVQERASLLDALLLAPPGFRHTGIETLHLAADRGRIANLGFPPFQRQLELGLTNEVLRNVRSTSDFTPLLVRLLLREIGLDALLPSRPPP
ncbi:MAG: hypothetical protein KF833_06335 [Verrucomicrobiae bacterium]|nr:hypothetical protein [Verrucomicrobiae bacterium]